MRTADEKRRQQQRQLQREGTPEARHLSRVAEARAGACTHRGDLAWARARWDRERTEVTLQDPVRSWDVNLRHGFPTGGWVTGLWFLVPCAHCQEDVEVRGSPVIGVSAHALSHELRALERHLVADEFAPIVVLATLTILQRHGDVILACDEDAGQAHRRGPGAFLDMRRASIAPACSLDNRHRRYGTHGYEGFRNGYCHCRVVDSGPGEALRSDWFPLYAVTRSFVIPANKLGSVRWDSRQYYDSVELVRHDNGDAPTTYSSKVVRPDQHPGFVVHQQHTGVCESCGTIHWSLDRWDSPNTRFLSHAIR